MDGLQWEKTAGHEAEKKKQKNWHEPDTTENINELRQMKKTDSSSKVVIRFIACFILFRLCSQFIRVWTWIP
jgi:hypothetical protein